MEASRHHDIALKLFNISKDGVTQENCDACFTFSALIVTYAWASSNGTYNLFFNPASAEAQETVEWVRLVRGISTLLECSYEWVKAGPLGALLSAPNICIENPQISSDDTSRFTSLERLWSPLSSRLTAAEASILHETLRILVDIYSKISHEAVDPAGAALAWPIRVSNDFIQMVNRQQEEALILLAHYCLVLNKVDDCWFMR